jgi:hypothetical protein
MLSRNVMDRLGAGELLLMDGGTGSEIQRRQRRMPRSHACREAMSH